jgi:hypothetical protein
MLPQMDGWEVCKAVRKKRRDDSDADGARA